MLNRSWLLVVCAAGLDSTVHYVQSLECMHTRMSRTHTHTSCRLVHYCREVSIVRRGLFCRRETNIDTKAGELGVCDKCNLRSHKCEH